VGARVYTTRENLSDTDSSALALATRRRLDGDRATNQRGPVSTQDFPSVVMVDTLADTPQKTAPDPPLHTCDVAACCSTGLGRTQGVVQSSS